MNKGHDLPHGPRADGDVAFKSLLHDFYVKYAEAAPPSKTSKPSRAACTSFRQSRTAAPGFSAASSRQWLNSTGVPDSPSNTSFTAHTRVFRVVGKIKQPLDTFTCPSTCASIPKATPKPRPSMSSAPNPNSPWKPSAAPSPRHQIDPNNVILKGSSTAARRAAAIARAKNLPRQGPITTPSASISALFLSSPVAPLAHSAWRSLLLPEELSSCRQRFPLRPTNRSGGAEKWTEVWSHIYLGKIFDLLGQRARAVNEYSKAKQTNDDTAAPSKSPSNSSRKPTPKRHLRLRTRTGAAPGAAAVPPQAPPTNDRPVLKSAPTPPPTNPFTASAS